MKWTTVPRNFKRVQSLKSNPKSKTGKKPRIIGRKMDSLGIKITQNLFSVSFRAGNLTTHFPHVHRVHAGGADGLQTEFGVLVGAAEFWLHADAPRGFEKNVRRGFLVIHHLAGHDRVKKVTDFQVFQRADDDWLRAAGPYGHRNFSEVGLRDFNDGVNRFDLSHERQIDIFLFMRHGDRSEERRVG